MFPNPFAPNYCFTVRLEAVPIRVANAYTYTYGTYRHHIVASWYIVCGFKTARASRGAKSLAPTCSLPQSRAELLTPSSSHDMSQKKHTVVPSIQVLKNRTYIRPMKTLSIHAACTLVTTTTSTTTGLKVENRLTCCVIDFLQSSMFTPRVPNTPLLSTRQ
ncbi:hypothetical protein ACJQWK_08066 [Exserohilum turcicum]